MFFCPPRASLPRIPAVPFFSSNTSNSAASAAISAGKFPINIFIASRKLPSPRQPPSPPGKLPPLRRFGRNRLVRLQLAPLMPLPAPLICPPSADPTRPDLARDVFPSIGYNFSAPRVPHRRYFVSLSSSPRKIGFIGLGLMGRPMAMNLLKAGHSLTVWNRTASRAQELVAAGAALAKSPRQAAAASDILFTIVSDPPALEQVLWGNEGKDEGALAGLRSGSIYVDSSTVAPALTRRVAAACTEHQVRYLDAPVTGGDWGAREGNLVFMIGGEP